MTTHKKAKAPTSSPSPSGLRIIAAIKLFKGLLLLLLGLGVFRLLNKDLTEVIHKLTLVLKIDPEGDLAQKLLSDVVKLDPQTLKKVGYGSVFYSLLFLTEGIGLWLNKSWAEYLLVIATGLFVPFEIRACIHKPTWIHFSALVVNVAILVYVVWIVWKKRKEPKGKKRAA